MLISHVTAWVSTFFYLSTPKLKRYIFSEFHKLLEILYVIFLLYNSGSLCDAGSNANIIEKCEESSAVCEAVYITNHKTCDEYCQSFGLICNAGWDEKDNTCDGKLETAEDSRRTGDGCNESYYHQICRCMHSDSACHVDADIIEKCEESSEVCEAVFVTDDKTCDEYCQSFGLTCNAGWDEDDRTCDGKLETADDPRRTGDGCNQSYYHQICRCVKTGK